MGEDPRHIYAFYLFAFPFYYLIILTAQMPDSYKARNMEGKGGGKKRKGKYGGDSGVMIFVGDKRMVFG